MSEGGITVCVDKMRAVTKFPTPMILDDVRHFTGLAGFYKPFRRNFTRIAKPLTDFLKKGQAFVWNAAQQEAFETLKLL